MKKNRLLYLIIIMTLLLSFSSCEESDNGEGEKDSGTVTEETEAITDEAQIESIEAPDDEVSPEFDENGNPTGEYAKYLWEQEQMEEAMNSLAEDAMREQYEEDYETHVFPLD